MRARPAPTVRAPAAETNLLFKWYGNAGADRLSQWADEEGEYSTTIKDSAYLAQAQHQVEQALLSHIGEQEGLTSDANLDVSLVPYPKVKTSADQTVSQNFGSLFIFCALAFSAITLTTRVVSEKERHITGSMRSTGMLESAYWLSYWAPAAINALLVSVIVYIVGAAFDLQIFSGCNGLLLILVFFTFTLAMAPPRSTTPRSRTALSLARSLPSSGLASGQCGRHWRTSRRRTTSPISGGRRAGWGRGQRFSKSSSGSQASSCRGV